LLLLAINKIMLDKKLHERRNMLSKQNFIKSKRFKGLHVIENSDCFVRIMYCLFFQGYFFLEYIFFIR